MTLERALLVVPVLLAAAPVAADPTPDLDAPWACIGEEKKAKKPRSPTATYTNRLMEFRLGPPAPYAGVTVSACLREDRLCEHPVAATVAGPDGAFALELPLDKHDGFVGYLELAGAGVQPTLLFLDPITEDTHEPFVFALRVETFLIFAAGAGVTLDPGRGHVGMAAIGCDGLPAAGVRFESAEADAGTLRVCSGPGGVRPENSVTSLPSGHCGFFNMPLVDEVRVEAHLDDVGLTYGAFRGFCRAGYNCELPLRPRHASEEGR